MIDCQQIASSPPVWVITLAGLLTPLIALIALYIACQQLRTNRNKLKLDLFKLRFSFYDATRLFISQVIANSCANTQQLNEFQSRIRDANFLFDNEIYDYLFEMYKKAAYLAADYEVSKNMSEGQEKINNLNRQQEIRNWFISQEMELYKKFAKFMKLKH
jgi:hypothetical protein